VAFAVGLARATLLRGRIGLEGNAGGIVGGSFAQPAADEMPVAQIPFAELDFRGPVFDEIRGRFRRRDEIVRPPVLVPLVELRRHDK
jgi:hypothetical protein